MRPMSDVSRGSGAPAAIGGVFLQRTSEEELPEGRPGEAVDLLAILLNLVVDQEGREAVRGLELLVFGALAVLSSPLVALDLFPKFVLLRREVVHQAQRYSRFFSR